MKHKIKDWLLVKQDNIRQVHIRKSNSESNIIGRLLIAKQELKGNGKKIKIKIRTF